MNLRLVALGITVAIETPIVALVFRQQAARLALACVVTTSVTNLFMNFVLRRELLSGLLVGEALAFALEAFVYYRLSSPRSASRALIASLLANAASYFGGVVGFRLLR